MRITWSEYTHRTRNRYRALAGFQGQRTGVIWSQGPELSTLWVVPDERREKTGLDDGAAEEEGHAILVRVSKKDGFFSFRDEEMSTVDYQRSALASIKTAYEVPDKPATARWLHSDHSPAGPLRTEHFLRRYATTLPSRYFHVEPDSSVESA